MARANRAAPCAPFLLLLALACGGGEGETAEAPSATAGAETPPPPKVTPLAILPEDAFGVVQIDVAALRASPYTAELARWARAFLDEEAAGSGTLMNQAWDHTDRLLVAVVPPRGTSPRAGEVVAVVTGRLDEEMIETWLTKGAEQAGEAPPARTERGGRTLFTVEKAQITELEEGIWLIADDPQLDPALERIGETGRGPLDGGLLGTMAERIAFDEATVAAVVAVDPTMARRLGAPIDQQMAEDVEALAGRAHVADGLQMKVVGKTRTEAGAKDIADSLSAKLRRTRRNPILRVLGLGPLVNGAAVKNGGTEVEVTLQLSDPDTRALLARLESFLEAASFSR